MSRFDLFWDMMWIRRIDSGCCALNFRCKVSSVFLSDVDAKTSRWRKVSLWGKNEHRPFVCAFSFRDDVYGFVMDFSFPDVCTMRHMAIDEAKSEFTIVNTRNSTYVHLRS